MSSAVSPSQVTSSTPILVTTPSSDTKSFNEHKRDEFIDDQRQQLNKQLNKTYTRGNSNKNKQLTRSHAMKESASPPRTPNSHSPNDMKSHSPTAPALMNPGEDGLQNTSAAVASSSSLLLTAPPFILPESNSAGGKSQLDIEFPKLTPPKTKVGWNSSSPSTGGSQRSNNSRKSVSSDTSSTNNSLCEDINESHINDKGSQPQQQQQQKTGSQTISVSTTCTQISSASSPLCDKKQQQYLSSNDNNNECEKNLNESFNNINLNNNNNNINNSSNSNNNNNNNNNNHDERVISPSRAQCKSPNYNDSNNNNGSSKSTPPVYPLNIKGKPPLKNMGSSSSFEGGNTSSGFISRDSSSEQFVDQNGIDLVQFFKETLNKNAKDRNMLMKIERDLSQLAVDQTGRTFIKFPPMSSYNRMLVHRTAAYFGMDHNVDSTQQCVIASTTKDTRIPDIRFKTLIRDTFSEEPRKSILKREAHSFEDYRQGGLLSVQRSILNRKAKSFEERDEEYEKYEKKSHSFGGYGGSNATLMRDDSITSSRSAGPRLHKQDSTTSTTWRLSPSSSGYKTQSLRSDSSPTGGYGSDTPEPSSAQSPDASRGVVWAVTDLASVPKGSLIIDPQTLQPILNQDGSLYHFDPSNPPTTSARYSNTGNSPSQCELKPQSSHLNAEELMSPKQKNQSTSPNLPITENTINDDEESVTPTSSVQPIIEENVHVDLKKDELTSVTETPPVQEIRFQTNPYSNNTAVTATPTLPPVLGYPTAASFTTTPIETAGTIYHTGPDGTLYVLSQPVMYSYTTTSTENEVPSCWVPIFDQGARDPNLTVMPVATPYNGPTLYQSPVVYSTEQFTNQPAIAGQYPVGAYPMGYATYPVNGAPYQNIWPQPMTYFLPPSATPGPTQTVLVPPAAPQTPNATLIQSTASNTHTPSTNSIGRRNSPPTNNHHVHTTTAHGSSAVQTSTAMPIQTFPSSVPFSLAATSDTTSASGPALYAIPPSVYPNVLQYPASATGYYQPLPHPQTNTTIISSVIPHSSAHPSSTVPSTPHSYHTTGIGGEILTHFPFSHQPPGHSNGHNATSTPQSAPSTPLSLTTMPPNFKNPPLFTTQPLIATAPVHIAAHYDNDKKTSSITSMSSAPKKYNNGGNGILSTPPTAFPQHSNLTKPSNGGSSNRQPPLASYQPPVSAQGGKKSINNSNNNNNNNNNNSCSNSHSEDTNSLSNSNMSSNYSSSNRIKNSSSNRDQTSSASGSYQPKSSYNNNNNNKSQQQQQQHHQQSYSSNSNSPNSNDNSESTNVSVSGSNNGKYPPRGPGSRIPPLDLKRNNSSANVVPNHHTRSTPSTNSTESNNSPNSITSYDHSRNYHYTSQHYQHQHHPQQHHHQQYHQTHYASSNTSGHNSGTHYYRGGSAGAINTNIHHNTNNNSHNSTESPSIQTCFPFNVHSQNPGTSTPLLDSCHPQQLIGYNNPMAAGMYVKFGQAFTFANPLPNNRKSPSNDIRAPLAGVYSTMMLPGGPRQMNPRTMQNNHNYKGNRTQQR
ncbi:hypothetical protein ACKWTF_004281 [Chironomus riparius]